MIAHDTAGTEAAISDIAQSVAAIRPFVLAVEAIALGPQPLFVDGQTVGSWDPLGSAPDVESALATAKQHCFDFHVFGMDVLAAYPSYLATQVGPAGGPGIVNDLAQVAAVMAALGGGAPTAAQRQAVDGALADLLAKVASLQAMLAEVQTHAATFQSNLSTDIQNLDNNAPSSVATGLATLQSALENAVTQYALGPGGSAVVAILEQISGEMSAALTAIQGHLSDAEAAQGSVTPALARLQNLFSGLHGAYAAFAAKVQSASDAEFGGILQQIDCRELQQYWQDTSAYATAHGFGVPAG